MGLEWGFRLVARQNRLGFLREGLAPNTTSIPVETITPGFVTSYMRGYYHSDREACTSSAAWIICSTAPISSTSTCGCPAGRLRQAA